MATEHISFSYPPNTARATAVSQMYRISPNVFEFNTKYVIGQQQIVSDFVYKFKNITMNANLVVTVQVPSYMMVNINPSTLVRPNEEITIVIRFNKENATNQFLAHKQDVYNEQLKWSVKPINLTEPVYISL